METLPIAEPSIAVRNQTENLVRRLIDLTAEGQSGRRAVLDWLKVEMEIEKPTQKLADLAGLAEADFLQEVKKIRGKKSPLSVAGIKRLKEEYVTSILPLHTLAAEALGLERQVSDLVNEAYGLTPDEIELMWDTAPPRMPIPRPSTP